MLGHLTNRLLRAGDELELGFELGFELENSVTLESIFFFGLLFVLN